MPNDITVTKNTTVGSERWDVEYTADQAATVTKTMDTDGTMLDRDIKVTVTIPAGTEGTPTASVGDWHDYSVDVTPSVTNQAGYISGGTRTGQSVNVSAYDVTAGTKSITSSGTHDVTNYKLANVAAGTAGTPVATKGAVSGNSISVTPSVTNSAGFIASDTITGTAVTVSASELVSGTKNITTTGTVDVTNYAYASASAGTAGTPVANVSSLVNSVQITPIVTNTAGFIESDTIGGTPVTISASDLVSGTKSITASGTTDVTNYANASVAAGSATTPATTITANPTISVDYHDGQIAATVSKTQSVTPTVSAGFVSSGTAGTITVSGYTSTYLTTKSAQTYHPSTSDQTVAYRQYLTGAQTFKAVTLTNLTAENIKDGVTVKVGDSTDDDCVTSVTGTYTGGGGGGGSTTVSFSDDAIFTAGTGFITYVDGNGTYHNTSALAAMSAVTYDMLTSSLVSLVDGMDPIMSGQIYNVPSTLHFVDGGSLVIPPRTTIYYRIYQVG